MYIYIYIYISATALEIYAGPDITTTVILGVKARNWVPGKKEINKTK